MRWFFWVPTTYVLDEKYENKFWITHSYLKACISETGDFWPLTLTGVRVSRSKTFACMLFYLSFPSIWYSTWALSEMLTFGPLAKLSVYPEEYFWFKLCMLTTLEIFKDIHNCISRRIRLIWAYNIWSGNNHSISNQVFRKTWLSRPHYMCIRAQLEYNFLISQTKHMLWVLKRTVSIGWFFWAPKTHV